VPPLSLNTAWARRIPRTKLKVLCPLPTRNNSRQDTISMVVGTWVGITKNKIWVRYPIATNRIPRTKLKVLCPLPTCNNSRQDTISMGTWVVGITKIWVREPIGTNKLSLKQDTWVVGITKIWVREPIGTNKLSLNLITPLCLTISNKRSLKVSITIHLIIL
jgi:hypothetical protein